MLLLVSLTLLSGSPFAEAGNGSCVASQLADGGVAYYTYTTVFGVPVIPNSWYVLLPQ